MDDDGDATFVFTGRSCAAGPSAVIADVLAGSHPTYVTTYTVVAPTATFAPPMAAARGSRRHHHHNPPPTPPVNPPAMTVDVSPGPVIETGLPIGSTMPMPISRDGKEP